MTTNTVTINIEANKQIVLTFLEFAYNMDMQEALSMLTDDATWWVLGDPKRVKVAGLKDRARVEYMLSNMHKVLPSGMQHQIIGITAENNRVAVEIEAQGTWYNGAPYKNNYHFLFTIRDGKVASIREYLDTMQVLAH